MFATPLPTKRKLFITPLGSASKRRRFAGPLRNATAGIRAINHRTTRGPSSKGTLRQQVQSLQRIVKNLAPETKFVDVDLASSNITSAGTAVHLSQVAQGTAQSNRTGNTINVTSVTLLARWTRATDTSVAANSLYRFAVVVDKEQVGDTAPLAAAVLSGSPIGFLPNIDNLERFRILYLSPIYENAMMVTDSDNITSATIGAVPSQRQTMQFNWKGNIKVSYNGSAVTDIEKNGIYILFLSNDTGDVIDVAGTARLGYTDV